MICKSENTTFASEINNSTNNDFKYHLDNLHFGAYYILFPILLILGIITNALNILILWSIGRENKKSRIKDMKATLIYLTWISFGQLATCISCVPSVVNLDREFLAFNLAFYFAHFEIMILNSFTSSCVYIILAMSVDRYIAVCKPNSYSSINGPEVAVKRIVASLIIPPIIYIPHCFTQVTYCDLDGCTYCASEMSKTVYWTVWALVVELFHRLIPAVILIFFNVCIVLTFKKVVQIRNATRTKENLIKTSKKSNHYQEKRLMMLLVATTICFLVTTLPAAILGLIDKFGHRFESLGLEVIKLKLNHFFIIQYFFINKQF